MKRMLYALLAGALVAGLWGPSTAAAGGGGTTDVIIQATGSTDALVSFIQSIGGSVKFKYRNVPAVAASIPVDELANVGAFRGVTKVEKDRMVYLTGTFEDGKNAENSLSYAVEDMTGIGVEAIDPAAFSAQALPEGYANFIYTGALFTWGDTAAGDGSIVAVVDTGTVPNVCLARAVIGAPGYPDGYNATTDGVPATSPSNYWHGTVVGGVIASDCALNFSAAPAHPIYLAQEPFLGWPVNFVPILGQAPASQLYPVKVFPQSGAGSPTSVILDGFDHILTLKKGGLLDIDIVNMSFGGPTGWDGRDAYDRFIGELQAAGMLVVTSAGNWGPIPNSVGSPATSFAALSAAALDYAPSSRTFFEYLGLAAWPLAPGQGLIMRPTAETRVANFSARGPLSDGRFAPEIAALGLFNFHQGPTGSFYWAGGTSFASPTVAGAAALLNAWWEAQGHETDPVILENVLLLGADPEVVDPIWQGINDQGYGAVDVPASLDRLMSGQWHLKPPRTNGVLTANVLGKPVKNKVQTWESDLITLEPSEPFTAVFDIGQWTSNVTIEVFDIHIDDNWDYAYWANALEVHLQSAKRTSFRHPVQEYWYPWYGDSFDIVVEDGPWTFAGIPRAYQPMEPGLMKLSLIGDYSNESPVSFKVRITRENKLARPDGDRVANGVIKMNDSLLVPVIVPGGVSTATFDLLWHRDWSMFPTSDVDMYLFNPSLALTSVDGATSNAPERAIIENPTPGTWYVLINGYEVYKPDNFDLYMKLE